MTAQAYISIDRVASRLV